MDRNEYNSQTDIHTNGEIPAADLFTLEQILFLAEHKEEAQRASLVYVDKGETALVFCCLDREGDGFFFLTQSVMVQKGWALDSLYASAVQNLRKQFPCQCIPMEEYAKGKLDQVQLSRPAAEGIYTLACKGGNPLFAATGIYYSAKEVKELSEALHSPLYVFQFDEEAAFLCPIETFTREEATEIVEEFSKVGQNGRGQVLVYEDRKLKQLQEYQTCGNKNRGRSA